MAALTGYFDDSRTEGRIFTLAGYVGGERHWEVFQEQWNRALDLHEVPYFHMREFGKDSGPYKKWLPAKDHQRETPKFPALFGTTTRCVRLMKLGAAFGPKHGVIMPNASRQAEAS
jgi:hypothetical protein